MNTRANMKLSGLKAYIDSVDGSRLIEKAKRGSTETALIASLDGWLTEQLETATGDNSAEGTILELEHCADHLRVQLRHMEQLIDGARSAMAGKQPKTDPDFMTPGDEGDNPEPEFVDWTPEDEKHVAGGNA